MSHQQKKMIYSIRRKPMIKAEATGDKFSYGVMIRGYVDYSEYAQILENIEEIKKKIKAFGKEQGYEKEDSNG